MSWQSYVDDHLIGTGHVTQGAICGVDGALWAASEGFNVRVPPDLRTLIAAAASPRSSATWRDPLGLRSRRMTRGCAEDRGAAEDLLRAKGRLRGRRDRTCPVRVHAGGRRKAATSRRARAPIGSARSSHADEPRPCPSRPPRPRLETPRASRSPSPRPAPTSSTPPPALRARKCAAAFARAGPVASIETDLNRHPPRPSRPAKDVIAVARFARLRRGATARCAIHGDDVRRHRHPRREHPGRERQHLPRCAGTSPTTRMNIGM